MTKMIVVCGVGSSCCCRSQRNAPPQIPVRRNLRSTPHVLSRWSMTAPDGSSNTISTRVLKRTGRQVRMKSICGRAERLTREMLFASVPASTACVRGTTVFLLPACRSGLRLALLARLSAVIAHAAVPHRRSLFDLAVFDDGVAAGVAEHFVHQLASLRLRESNRARVGFGHS